MHSAFIRDEEGWKCVYHKEHVVNHVGQVIINMSHEEKEINLQLIAKQEGAKSAVVQANDVLFLNSKLFKSIGEPEAVEELQRTGEICVKTLYQPHDYIISWICNKKVYAHLKAFIYSSDIGHTIKIDEKAYDELYKKEKRNAARAKARRKNRKSLTTGDLTDAIGELAAGIEKYYFNTSRSQFILLIIGHDHFKGRRATNTILKPIAKLWCQDREKSKKWASKWYPAEHIELIDERLALVAGQRPKRKKLKPAFPLDHARFPPWK